MERYVVVYDIQDDDRRNKVHKILKNNGVAVQESVFEVNLLEEDLVRLQGDLLKAIRRSEDSLIFYRLCQGCAGSSRRHGLSHDPFAEQVMIL